LLYTYILVIATITNSIKWGITHFPVLMLEVFSYQTVEL